MKSQNISELPCIHFILLQTLNTHFKDMLKLGCYCTWLWSYKCKPLAGNKVQTSGRQHWPASSKLTQSPFIPLPHRVKQYSIWKMPPAIRKKSCCCTVWPKISCSVQENLNCQIIRGARDKSQAWMHQLKLQNWKLGLHSVIAIHLTAQLARLSDWHIFHPATKSFRACSMAARALLRSACGSESQNGFAERKEEAR